MATESSFNSVNVALGHDWFSDDDPGPRMAGLVREIRAQQQEERELYETCLALCMDSPGATINPSIRAESFETIGYEPLSLNVCEQISAAVHADIISSRVRPMFLTTGGNWGLRRRTKDANRWIDGLFADCGFYTHTFQAAASSMIRFGTGIVRVESEWGKVKIRHALPWQIVIDKVQGADRNPPCIYEQRYMDRHEAAARWPEHEQYLLHEAPGPTDEWAILTNTAADVVLVTEGFRRTIGAGKAKIPGRHVVTVGDRTIFDEQWEEDWFPYAFARYSTKPYGMFGRGVPEQLVGNQYNINKTAMVIDQCHENAPVSIWVQRGSKITKAHIQNGIGTIGEYDTSPPMVFAPQMVSPDMYAWLEREYQRAFERVGASQLSSRAELPAGLRNASGVALQAYVDQTNKRFTEPHQAIEAMVCEVAELVVKVVRRDGINPEARHSERGAIKVLKWSDISLEPPYSVTCWPVGLLPSTPAGKLQTLQEVFVQGGLANAIGMTPQMLCNLLGAPDLDSATRSLTAPQDNLERVIDTIIEEGRYIRPDSTWNVALGMTMAIQKSQELLCDGVPMDSEELGLLREWIADCNAIIEAQKPKPEAVPQGAAPGEMSPGPPSPPLVGGPGGAVQ